MTAFDTDAVTEHRYVRSEASWRESLFTVGNGYLMTRGSFEEPRVGEVRATFINGAFVTPPGELPLLGAVPDWTGFRFTVDGEPFDLDVRRPAGYLRRLDLGDGSVTRTVLWRGAATGTVRVCFRRLLPLDAPHLAVLEVGIQSMTDEVVIEFGTGIDADVASPTVPVWLPEEASQSGASSIAGFRSIDGVQRLDLAWRVDARTELTHIHDLVHPRVRGEVRLAPGERFTVTKLVGYRLGRDVGPVLRLPAEGVGFDAIAAGSRAAWTERWKASKVDIDGDPGAELALRYAAFQLIGAASPNDPGAGIGARIGGFGYRHHVFWDTDIFVAPYFSVVQPDLARNHLAYRYRGLGGARRKAARFGHPGAFYAWESAGTGDEVTPEWSSPLYGEPVRIWTGEIEEHITADVAWSAERYWNWTGDDVFMRDEGAEMILDGARYWMSRLEPEADGFHIRNVIGPDEYHIHVDDNFYTNLLAAWQLRTAGTVAQRLHRLDSAAYHQLMERLALSTAELADFAAAADRVVLGRNTAGVWEQHRGFFDLEALELRSFEPRLHSLYDILGEDRIQGVAVIKQADVLMAMALLPDESDRAGSAAANWAYYAPLADHGSSLSLSFHALLAAQMNDPELGYRLFSRAAAIDLEDSMGNGVDGIHTACQGGLLMTALFGFAGLELVDGRPVTHQRLPPHWKSMGIRFYHHGALHEVEVTR